MKIISTKVGKEEEEDMGAEILAVSKGGIDINPECKESLIHGAKAFALLVVALITAYVTQNDLAGVTVGTILAVVSKYLQLSQN